MAHLATSLEDCAQHIRSGGLVGFPTETVYGLGASIYNEEAVRSIFLAKGRPLSDPVIVHVNSIDEALSLIDETDSDILDVYRFLGNTFWPGPLTVVCKAASFITPLLTAGSGFLGVRCPNHSLARELIAQAGLPIAAPSANKFTHVSPTSAQHVIDDFKDSSYDIRVIDGGKCRVGVESTVIKLYKRDGVKISILRRGGISHNALNTALTGRNVEIDVIVQHKTEEDFAEAPGQMLKHYSPVIDTYLISTGHADICIGNLESAAVIDFGNVLGLKDCKAYRDLSPTGDVEEAMNNIYDYLRWSETTNASIVIIPEIDLSTPHDHIATLYDRVYRACAGRRAVLQNQQIFSLKS